MLGRVIGCSFREVEKRDPKMQELTMSFNRLFPNEMKTNTDARVRACFALQNKTETGKSRCRKE
jgi:hypothetical protein